MDSIDNCLFKRVIGEIPASGSTPMSGKIVARATRLLQLTAPAGRSVASTARQNVPSRQCRDGNNFEFVPFILYRRTSAARGPRYVGSGPAATSPDFFRVCTPLGG